MEQRNNRKSILSVVGITIALIALVGVTYAFFNYTRTGSENVIKVGRISFNTEQGPTINLINVFPIDKVNANTDTDNVGSVTIHVTGDTTYTEGVEYLVTAMDVNNTIGNKVVPIGIDVNYEEITGKEIGTSDSGYFTNRGGNTSLYINLAKDYLKYNNRLIAGYIKPDTAGIDGNITITAFIDKDKIAISDTYPEKTYREIVGEDTYSLNPNLTASELNYCVNSIVDIYDMPYSLNSDLNTNALNMCVSYIENDWEYKDELDEGTTGLSFCQGTGTSYGYTFQEWIDKEWFYDEEFSYFFEQNIITIPNKQEVVDFCQGTGTIDGKTFQQFLDDNDFSAYDLYYFLNENVISQVTYSSINSWTDGTTDEWVNGRTVLTTNEWNSLQQNGISFKIKVEANEGIWVEEETVNAMDDNKFTGFGLNGSVVGIYFQQMDSEEIQQRYNRAEYKEDITANNEGQVLEWLELDEKDNTKYNLYVASTGETYLTKGEYLFFTTPFNNAEVVEMKNVNVSRTSSLSKMFSNLKAVKKIDLRDLKGLENVEIMSYLFDGCTNLVEVNMSGLDLSNVESMSYLFKYCSSLKNIYLNGITMDSIVDMDYVFYYCTSLEKVDMVNLGGNDLNNITYMFSGCSKLKIINMQGFNFGTSELDDTFSEIQNLEIIDFTNVDIGQVTDMRYLFKNDTKLKTIYVSNTWNVDDVTYDYNMFDNCTSLVGGNGTTYDDSKTDKSMAVIDNNEHEGYLTLKTT